ncbi:MAG TPA: hypothetical protein VJN18_10650, partial [Polyangiaceae bacterium]|nr:hypothetical protein [Polyangiaceae bacterium]
PRFATPKPAADFDTLHAVIANRYDVLSRYAKGFSVHLGKPVDSELLTTTVAGLAQRGVSARDRSGR